MGFLIVLVPANVLFVALLGTIYVLVGRRRWRLVLLVEHLAALTRQGMPVHTGLRAVGRDLGGFLGSRVVRAAQFIEEGMPLGEAFQGSPGTFPSLFRSMLKAGDRSGNLAAFLEEMRRSYRRIAELPQNSVYLLIYPLILSLFINAAVLAIYRVLVPRLQTILFQASGQDPTRTWWPKLVAANEGVLALCILTIAFLMLGGFSLHFGPGLFRFLKRGVDRLLLVTPLVRSVLRDGSVQQLGICSGLLLRFGATLPEALLTAAEIEPNSVIRARLLEVARQVSEGARLSRALKGAGGFADDLLWFVETGEASGLLADHLLLASSHYGTKARLSSRVALHLVVPTFVVLNAGVVLSSFLLIYAPIGGVLRKLTGGNG